MDVTAQLRSAGASVRLRGTVPAPSSLALNVAVVRNENISGLNGGGVGGGECGGDGGGDGGDGGGGEGGG
eukprot:1572983-Prymnesium_polylepis.1